MLKDVTTLKPGDIIRVDDSGLRPHTVIGSHEVLVVIPSRGSVVVKGQYPQGNGWAKGYEQWVQDACKEAGIPVDQSIRLVYCADILEI